MPRNSASRRVVMVAFPSVQVLDVVGPLEVFGAASQALEGTGGAPAYQVEIVATRAGRRVEITTARGVVEVSEVTRSGTPVRTGRFMQSRLVALVEHPAHETTERPVDVSTRRRLGAGSASE